MEVAPMKKPMTITLAVLLAAISAALFSPLIEAENAGVQSLRTEDVAAPDQAPEDKPYVGKTPGEQEKIARTYEQQPPLIPHKIDGYRIDFKKNRCLECHDRPFYKEENSPKIGDSHYRDREGKQLKHISMGRYDCIQCHVPQADAKPLVENTFQSVPVKAAKGKKR
jgi:cytochrome c-type protein NapB